MALTTQTMTDDRIRRAVPDGRRALVRVFETAMEDRAASSDPVAERRIRIHEELRTAS